MNVNKVGLFPEWVPGTPTALLHNGQFISKCIDTYVRTAATAPRARTYLINKSNCHDTALPTKWSDEIFDDVNWWTHGASIRSKPEGHQIQISKFVNEKAPTKLFLSTFNNSIDSWCFACGSFNEDSAHVLRCTSALQTKTCTQALHQFRDHLARDHTPKPMADSLMETMERWLKNLPYQPPTFNHQEYNEFDQRLLTSLETAFQWQTNIGWAHFFWGWLTKTWSEVIAVYYREQWPDEPHNPSLWMRKMIDQIWDFYIALWHCRNGELHGHDFDEQKRIALKATQMTIWCVYQEMTNNVQKHHTRILHWLPVEEILKWTKTHLDAYLVMAEVILEQNINPGWAYHPLVS